MKLSFRDEFECVLNRSAQFPTFFSDDETFSKKVEYCQRFDFNFPFMTAEKDLMGCRSLLLSVFLFLTVTTWASPLTDCVLSYFHPGADFKWDELKAERTLRAAQADRNTDRSNLLWREAFKARGWPVEGLTDDQITELARTERFGSGQLNKVLKDNQVALQVKQKLFFAVIGQLESIEWMGKDMDTTHAHDLKDSNRPKVRLHHVQPSTVLKELGPVIDSGNISDLESKVDSLTRSNVQNRATLMNDALRLSQLRAYYPSMEREGFFSKENPPSDDLFAGAQMARQMLRQNMSLKLLSESDQKMLEVYEDALLKYEKLAFSGRNKMLTEIRFKEPTQQPPARGTIDQFIRSNRVDGGWWRDFITPGVLSRSPIRALYGPDSQRVFRWPMEIPFYRSSKVSPQISKFVVVENQAFSESTQKMEPKSTEVFVKRNGGWEPFFYEKKGLDWIPSQEFMGKPVREACAECHMNPKGAFNPTPYKKIKTEADLKAVGMFDKIQTTWNYDFNTTLKDFFHR